jgi:hypothetical protein
VQGKWSKLWAKQQYAYAQRFQLTDASKYWQVSFIRALANALFCLWEIHNDCRHGIDNATKSQAQSEQTQQEIQCLFELREPVLPQDCAIFHNSVEDHLKETQAQQCTWITHNKKFIAHSARFAAHQASLHIQQLKWFFPLRRKVQSQMTNPKSTETWRFNIAPLTAHFSTRFISRSTVRKKNKEKTKSYNTPTMSSYYDPNKVSTSRLPTINKDTACKRTSPHQPQT